MQVAEKIALAWGFGSRSWYREKKTVFPGQYQQEIKTLMFGA
jgi:hypothetical protein